VGAAHGKIRGVIVAVLFYLVLTLRGKVDYCTTLGRAQEKFAGF